MGDDCGEKHIHNSGSHRFKTDWRDLQKQCLNGKRTAVQSQRNEMFTEQCVKRIKRKDIEMFLHTEQQKRDE